MTIRPSDILFYAGGECFQKFGVPVWGMSSRQRGGPMYTRSSALPIVGRTGAARSISANRIPIEWLDLDHDDVRETPAILLGPGRTNLITSDDFDGGWSSNNTPVVTPGVSDPYGGTGAFTIADNDAALAEDKRITVTFTGDGVKAARFVVRENTFPAGGQSLRIHQTSSTPADRLRLDISAWVNGEPTVAASAGTYLGKLYKGNGYWDLHGLATSVVAAETNVAIIRPTETVANTGSIDVYRVNAFNITSLTPYSILGASAGSGDATLYAPWIHAPREMTIYLKFLEAGWFNVTSARLLHIGSATVGDDPRLSIHSHTPASNAFYAITYDNGVASPDDAILTTAPAMGDTVELRAVLRSGSLEIGQSINGGTETVATDPTTPTLASTWAKESGETRIYLGSAGTGNRSGNPIIVAKIVAGDRSMDEMRSVFAWEPVV